MEGRKKFPPTSGCPHNHRSCSRTAPCSFRGWPPSQRQSRWRSIAWPSCWSSSSTFWPRLPRGSDARCTQATVPAGMHRASWRAMVSGRRCDGSRHRCAPCLADRFSCSYIVRGSAVPQDSWGRRRPRGRSHAERRRSRPWRVAALTGRCHRLLQPTWPACCSGSASVSERRGSAWP